MNHLPHHCSHTRIAPQTGNSFRIKKGQILRITDPLGEQVADLFSVNQHDHRCTLSSGRSLDYASKIYLTKGDLLYANDSQVMFTILEDTVGKHDFLLTPCSQEMFEILYKHVGHHPSCFENLRMALAPHGIQGHLISTTFNVFMNVNVHEGGRLTVDPPLSKPGDHVDLRAEMDMICGLTACSAEGSNNGSFKPIEYSIRDA
ncbi:urea carboxylase-associated family protein [Aquabacterium sp.]|uniref:urea carboxylase-associated family protein n=1 Tax=Aquabacterium sp. TaxID=1872578 RepID=UPI002486EA71|nr:urea carboxylase-associated family protein [Aquabacterium sp.]MDI1257675.1 urea carboxylase-associated family protein [Aquabacterium sp.]